MKTKLSDEESYHGDLEDNDNLNESYTKTVDEESYHGDFEDNENPEGEILGDLEYHLNNERQLTLYCSRKTNDLNLNEDKLRLVQRFMRCPGMFYEFFRDLDMANSVNAIYDFMITNNCRLFIRASPFEKTLEIRVPPYQYEIINGLSSQEMDRLQPIFIMEEHINFCVLYSGRSYIGSEPVKIGILQFASSIIPKEHCSNIRPIIQEVNNEQLDKEVVNLDDESEEESENDPIA